MKPTPKRSNTTAKFKGEHKPPSNDFRKRRYGNNMSFVEYSKRHSEHPNINPETTRPKDHLSKLVLFDKMRHGHGISDVNDYKLP